MNLTDTELEADLQAALSRAANHRTQPDDWNKLQPATYPALLKSITGWYAHTESDGE